MRVTASVKRRCPGCRVIKRHGNVMVILFEDPKHKKQRQERLGKASYGTYQRCWPPRDKRGVENYVDLYL